MSEEEPFTDVKGKKDKRDRKPRPVQCGWSQGCPIQSGVEFYSSVLNLCLRKIYLMENLIFLRLSVLLKIEIMFTGKEPRVGE